MDECPVFGGVMEDMVVVEYEGMVFGGMVGMEFPDFKDRRIPSASPTSLERA